MAVKSDWLGIMIVTRHFWIYDDLDRMTLVELHTGRVVASSDKVLYDNINIISAYCGFEQAVHDRTGKKSKNPLENYTLF